MNNDPTAYAGKASGYNDSAGFPGCSRYKYCLLTEKSKISWNAWKSESDQTVFSAVRQLFLDESCNVSVKSLGCTIETCLGPSLQRNAPLQFPPETYAKNNPLPSAHKECEYPK